jgi:hypothetical protein
MTCEIYEGSPSTDIISVYSDGERALSEQGKAWRRQLNIFLLADSTSWVANEWCRITSRRLTGRLTGRLRRNGMRVRR